MKREDPCARSQRRLKLMIVDDQAMLLDVLKRQFADDEAFEVVGMADSVDAALAMGLARRPDVAMLDIDLGGGASGLDLVPSLKAEVPQIRIVMVSMFDHEMYRDRAFEVGADAYATKGISFESLRDVLRGSFKLANPEDEKRYWRRMDDSGRTCRKTLSDQELCVVRMLVDGQKETEIARALGITVSSVGTYLRRIMIKTGCTTRAALFRLAVAFGANGRERAASGRE